MQLSDVTNLLGITGIPGQEPAPPGKPVFDVESEGEKKILYAWEAPARAQKKGIDKKFLRTILVIAAVVALLLIIMQEYLLILVIVSVAFMSHILSITAPVNVQYEASNHGLNYMGKFYYWNELKNYYFTTSGAGEVLNVDVKEGLPARLFLTIKPGDKEKIHEIFGKYLPYLEKPPETIMDKAYSAVVDKLDFEAK